MEHWYNLEKSHSHFHINADDTCIYAREYKSQKGYGGSRTNQLILNFKKSPDRERNRLEWNYRIKAVKTFAREAALLPLDLNTFITAIPSSKHKLNSEYDKRFEDLFDELLKLRPFLNIEWPVEIRQTSQPSHIEGRRNPESIKANYEWKGFAAQQSPKTLWVFDDVLTTGAHFRAMSDFLRENRYKGQIIGVFWSRARSHKKASAAPFPIL